MIKAKKNLRFITDPGHGWLEVPISLIRELGISDQISRFSYQKGEMAFLEEDCDASLFVSKMKDKGIEVSITSEYQEVTPIRRYSRFGTIA